MLRSIAVVSYSSGRTIVRLHGGRRVVSAAFADSSTCRHGRSFSTSSSSDEDIISKTNPQQQQQSAAEANGVVIVYESPLAHMVTRLRAVSLLSAVSGTIGLPAFVALRGVELPSTGMLACAMMFVSASVASTAAVHYVFSPYVYRIEKIPIRKCQAKNLPADWQDKQECMLKAISKSIFLTSIETVFHPATDVIPYKGYRPLCNFIAKGVPLYVHPEYVHTAALRRQLHLREPPAKSSTATPKDNPDDFF